NQVAAVSRLLNREKFEPWVIYAVRPGTTAAEFEKMTRFAAGHVHVPEMVREINPRKDWAAFWRLYRLLQVEKPDAVHLESSKAGALGRAAAWLAGVPRIYYSPHGYGFLQTDAGRARRCFYWSAEKALSWIGNIIACSDGEADLARGLSWGKEVFQVRNIFLFEDATPGAPKAEDGSVVFGALGRLTPARNPEAFLRMAEALGEKFPKARFVWIGGGELEAEFRRQVERSAVHDRFEVTGHVPRERVLETLAGLDVFVHYSRWEGGAPIAIHEAMHFGKPVLASHIAGNVDLVVPGVSGLLASNEDELLGLASELAASTELRDRLGRGAKAFLEREVSAQKSIAALERLYAR
ncbi:MAG: glycosyltransferase, partial [Elusimicrobia bacterium]|nr:glycosyltransferase [Elusimicrobiota bacterium]